MLLVTNSSMEIHGIWSHLENKPFVFQTRSLGLPRVKLLNTNTLQTFL